jgi:hypothetical protein
MAAKTPSTTTRASMGDHTLFIAPFTDIDDGDYWTSAIPGIVTVWTKMTKAITSASSTCLAASVSNFATGEITMTTGLENLTGTLFVMAKC